MPALVTRTDVAHPGERERMVSFPFTLCSFTLEKKLLEFIYRTLVIKDVFSVGQHAGEYAAEEKPA